MSKIEVNTVAPQCGTTLTLGESGDTVVLGTGASQSGFGRTGTVDWQTTPKTATFTATSGEGYFCNTAGGSFEVDLPTGSPGSIVSVQDYNNTFDTHSLIVDPPAGQKINGGTNGGKITLNTEGEGVTLVYVDSTVGWRSIHQSSFADVGADALFVVACGGNATLTCGDFKTHVFTGPGTFTVSCGGNACGSNSVEYLVVGGGGAGGTGEGCSAGGGGAGGFRTRTALPSASPLNAPANLPVSAQGYPIVVGAGGASESYLGPIKPGSLSSFSTISAAGGGAGRPGRCAVCGTPGYNPVPAMNGGSGGGATGNGGPGIGGVGNTPPVSPAQGRDGGDGNLVGGNRAGGGGGGAITEGGCGTNPNVGGPGGAGGHVPTAFIGPTAPSYGQPGPAGRYFAGGGGGNKQDIPEGSYGTGGLGGGGAGGNPAGTAGTVNTGSGGGAGYNNCIGSGVGGSGIVMIRYKFQ